MSYTAPFIDSAGLHLPSYLDIRDELITKVKAIYGADIYLEEDSQDYQFISTFALMLYDANQGILLAYNNANPITAVGTGLDRLVALNGIDRNGSSYSSVPLTITGVAGTVIDNGIAQDDNATRWRLPTEVIIPTGGTINVVATCITAGQVQTTLGGVNQIVTPVVGWTLVVNTALATLGAADESDSSLRVRQSISASIAATTPLDAILSAILDLDDVTKAIAYENDTAGMVGVYPAHSITLVVKDGTDQEIGDLIYNKKTIGCATYGSTSVTVSGQYGQVNTIHFQRPTDVAAIVVLHITALASYNAVIIDAIKANIVAYINTCKIGDDFYVSNLYAPILAATVGYDTSPFYITALTVNTQASVLTLTDFQNLLATTTNITITVA
jgi:uncharacterized phage protein gp47/JayE